MKTMPQISARTNQRLDFKIQNRSLGITFLIFSIALLSGSRAFSQVTATEGKPDAQSLENRPPRNVFWSFESNLIGFEKILPDNSTLRGPAGSFTAGYGRTRENSWISIRLHVLSGPWTDFRDHAFNTEFGGTMFDLEYGTAFPGFKLRSGGGPILSLAGGYLDISGRNIGGNRNVDYENSDPSSLYSEKDFKLGIGELTITPAIGWSWTKPSRPTGNEMELQITRVESSMVKFGVIVPLYSRARITVTKRDKTSSFSEQPQQTTHSGQVKGYGIVTTVSVWLGV